MGSRSVCHFTPTSSVSEEGSWGMSGWHGGDKKNIYIYIFNALLYSLRGILIPTNQKNSIYCTYIFPYSTTYLSWILKNDNRFLSREQVLPKSYFKYAIYSLTLIWLLLNRALSTESLINVFFAFVSFFFSLPWRLLLCWM